MQSLARIKIKFPDKLWISSIFTQFPDIHMEIINFLPYDLENSIGNSIIEIKHHKSAKIIEAIKIHPSVKEFSLMEQNTNIIKFNVKTQDPLLLYAIIKYGILINFPINVKQGWAYWRLVSSRKNLDDFLTFFEGKKIPFEVLRIGLSPYEVEDKENVLSYNELQILNEAIDKGFFEIPRKISLEELANSLGKSKSVLSVQMRKIIKKKVLLKA